MVGFTDEVAGDFGIAPLFRLTTLLNEGNIQLVEDVELGTGFVTEETVTRADRIYVGDLVELYDDEAFTYDATGGLPTVRKVVTEGAIYIGRVVKIELAPNRPRTTTPVTAIADMLENDYLRYALVEFLGIEGAIEAEVVIPLNGGGADSIDVANPLLVAYSIASGKWLLDNAGHEAVPLHHIEGSTQVETTGKVMMAFGPRAIKVVA